MNTIGIDVGCKELVVVIMVNGKARKAKSFDNTPSGHQTIIQSLTKLKGETKVCIEATVSIRLTHCLKNKKVRDTPLII